MKFSHEYSKLNKKTFTTIRRNSGRYKLHCAYRIHAPGQDFYAKVIERVLINKADINDSLAQADADMTAVELVALLEKLYGKDYDGFVLLTLRRYGEVK